MRSARCSPSTADSSPPKDCSPTAAVASSPSRLSRAKIRAMVLIDPKYDADKLAHGVEIPGTPKGIDRFVISPGNRLIWGFDCMIAVCVLTTAIVTPMEVAYGTRVLGLGVDVAIDVLFLVDMALQSVHGYQDGGYPVLSLRRVGLRYAHSWLLIDLVAVLPWEFIAPAARSKRRLGSATQLATPAAPLPREAGTFGSGWLSTLWRSGRAAQRPAGGCLWPSLRL